MKTINLIIALIAALTIQGFGQSDRPINNYCKCKNIPLHGDVEVVDGLADFKVKIVDSFEDLRIEVVTSFPDECGEWRLVESFPDFTIEFVESFADFEIRFVESFPGIDKSSPEDSSIVE